MPLAARHFHEETDVKQKEIDKRQEEEAQDEKAQAPQADEAEDPRQPEGVKVHTKIRSGGYLWND